MTSMDKVLSGLSCVILITGFNFGIGKGSPGTSSKDPFKVLGTTSSNDAKGSCVGTFPPPISVTARSTSTTSANRPIVNSWYPSQLNVKSVLVKVPFFGKPQALVDSDYGEYIGTNMKDIKRSVTYEYNCSDIGNVVSAVLGYGFHKALPSNDDPTPNGGRTVIYSNNSGGEFISAPW